jgi:hypothetical protein
MFALLGPVFLFSGLMGCKKTVDAPATLAELSPWLWQSFDDEDPEVLVAGLESLTAFAQSNLDLGSDPPWDERSFDSLNSFYREDVDGFVDHSRDPQSTVGVGIFYSSDHSVLRHLDIIGLEDQTPVEPSSPDHYVRDFVENTPACMADFSCEVLRSINDIHRDNVIYKLEYELFKDWRWIQLGAGEALLARSGNLDQNSNDGSVKVLQGYSIDVYLPVASGSLRYQTVWQETDLPGGLTDEQMTGSVLKGIDTLLDHHDAFLAGER